MRLTVRFLTITAVAAGLSLMNSARAGEIENDEGPHVEVNPQGVRVAQTTPPNPHVSAEVATAKSSPTPRPTPSENVTVNLVHRMVDRGLLSASDAEELIKQAEHDADIARARNFALRASSGDTVTSTNSPLPPPDVPTPTDGSAIDTRVPPAEGPANVEDEVRVAYVPEIVKQQLRDEIREQVLQQARDENWANPRVFPGWALRLTPFA